MYARYLGIALFLLVACKGKHEQPTKTIIAFGSCAMQDSINLTWDAIAAHSPETFIWLGDNIYGDSEDPAVLAAKYTQQKMQLAYQKLIKSGVKIMGTWDDHDYGLNDGGKEFSARQASKEVMLDFLDVPRDAYVRTHFGVYQKYIVGDEDRRVKIILLDTRWFRDALAPDTTSRGRYIPTPTGSMLGDTQWQWLEMEVRKADAEVLIIGSSIQVHAEEHGFEKWANFPHERTRLYTVLTQSSASAVVLISGDRHHAEVSRIKVGDRWLYDVTSSGMTHVYARATDEPNAHRISPVIVRRNWGLFEIVWEEQPRVHVEIRGINDTLYYQHELLK